MSGSGRCYLAPHDRRTSTATSAAYPATPPSGEPAPDQTLPGDLGEEVDENGKPIPPGQRPDKERGKSEDARGHNKPEPR